MPDERKYTILCVDDEPAILHSIRLILRRSPYEVLTAPGGDEAVALLATKTPHLVVSDYRMPRMNGIDFLIKVRELHPDAIRIILSGYVENSVILDALNSGAVHKFITKPWNDDKLRVEIRQGIEEYELRTENRRMTEKIREQNAELQRLNENLEGLVAERSRALLFSQEILVNLPIPILGVAADGTIVFGNRSAETLFGERYLGFFGNNANAVLSPAVAGAIDKVLNDGRPSLDLVETIDGNPTTVRCIALGESAEDRRAVVIFRLPAEGGKS